MPIDLEGATDQPNERKAIALEKLKADPLPASDRAARSRIEGEIAKYRLEKHIGELETASYTILPPNVGAPLKRVDRVQAAILPIADENERSQHTNRTKVTGTGRSYFHLVLDEAVFEEAVMPPITLL